MGYYDIAGHRLTCVVVVIGILYVLAFIAVSIRRSWKRALEIGFTREQLWGKSSRRFPVPLFLPRPGLPASSRWRRFWVFPFRLHDPVAGFCDNRYAVGSLFFHQQFVAFRATGC
jgi:hypothetical protein